MDKGRFRERRYMKNINGKREDRSGKGMEWVIQSEDEIEDDHRKGAFMRCFNYRVPAGDDLIEWTDSRENLGCR